MAVAIAAKYLVWTHGDGLVDRAQVGGGDRDFDTVANEERQRYGSRDSPRLGLDLGAGAGGRLRAGLDSARSEQHATRTGRQAGVCQRHREARQEARAALQMAEERRGSQVGERGLTWP